MIDLYLNQEKTDGDMSFNLDKGRAPTRLVKIDWIKNRLINRIETNRPSFSVNSKTTCDKDLMTKSELKFCNIKVKLITVLFKNSILSS